MTTDNLLALADSAFKSGDYREAESYYSRVLESDINHAPAWLGKGLASGWQSRVSDLKMGEMMSCVTRALEVSTKEQQAEITRRAAQEGAELLTVMGNAAAKQHSSHSERWAWHKAILEAIGKLSTLAPSEPELYAATMRITKAARHQYLTLDQKTWLQEVFGRAKVQLRNLAPNHPAMALQELKETPGLSSSKVVLIVLLIILAIVWWLSLL